MPEFPPPAAESPESFNWRTVHGVVVLLVLGLFLFSLRGMLNPFLLYLLFLFLISPYAGSRQHLLLVSATGILTLIWLLQTTGFLLAPFFLAVVLAYCMQPALRGLERRGVSRIPAVFLLALPGMAGITLVVVLGIPALGEEITGFIRRVPDIVRGTVAWAERMQLRLSRSNLPFGSEEFLLQRIRSVQPETVMAYLQERQEALVRSLWEGILGVGRGVGAILSILSYVFLTPILTFYLLRDWDRITASLAELVPPAARPRVVGFFREYDRLLASFLRGQFLAAAIVGVLTWLGFWIVGFPYALMLGVVAGVFNVIPYMGLVASLIPALLIALFSGDPLLALGKIALVVTVVQILDSAVLGPKIVGEAVGLHPVWVILALAVAGYFFGFVGLLIAVPLAVLVKLLLESALTRYRSSRLFQGEGPPRPVAGEA